MKIKKNHSFYNAFMHLKDDPVMFFLIKKFGNKITINDRYNSNYSKAISDLIIEQQVSFKAAITIKKKFNDLIKNLSNKEVINLNIEKIKNIGISFRKVEYIKNVYKFFLNNKIDFSISKNEDVIKNLTMIKGVGSWTAEMFLIFILFRKNIFSNKDLALINSIKINYNLPNLSKTQLFNLEKKWDPYKTTVSLLLWKSTENKIFYEK